MREREREVLELGSLYIAPMVDECATESCDYDEFFDDLGNLLEHQVWEDFMLVKDTIGYVDLERARCTHDVVVQRMSDGKSFFTTYDETLVGFDIDNYSSKLTEVFPVEKHVIEYV